MNKHTIIKNLLFLVFVGFLFSCENKVVDYGLDTYYVEIATAQSENIFLSDKGNKIVVTSIENKKNYASGDRVLINYTLIETDASGDFKVRLNGSAKIPLGKLTIANDSIISSSAKEPVLLESVWIGSHFLNMQFYINYKSAAHKIGLFADSISFKSDTIRMYFLHDKNNDPPGYPSHTYLSFDLKDVLGEPGNIRPMTIQINTSNYGNKCYGFEY